MGSSRHALSIATAVAFCVAATAIPSSAQTSDGPVLPAEHIPIGPIEAPGISVATADSSEADRRMTALQQWMRDFTKWQERESSRAQPQSSRHSSPEQRHKPDPPTWLFDACLDPAQVGNVPAEACELLVAWKDDPVAAQIRTKTATARTQGEAPTKTTWWTHVHLDALWLTPSSSSASYGVIGMHVTLKVAGRWQIFVAPGAILLNIPAADGTRAWQPAADMGFSYRLLDLQLPGTRREGSMHLNLARAWILGGAESAVNSSVDLIGLSFTVK